MAWKGHFAAILLLMLVVGSVHGAGTGQLRIVDEAALSVPLGRVVIVGNDTTQPEIIRQELFVQVGEVPEPRHLERSRQAVMDLGLFKDVDAELELVPGGGAGLFRIIVKEKYYILPLPLLDRSPEGDVTYGYELRLDNLGGLNQRLNVKRRVKHYGGSDLVRRSTGIGYAYPRVVGSRLRLDTGFSVAEIPAVSAASLGSIEGPEDDYYDYHSRSASLSISRWLSTGASRGWRAGGGVNWNHEAYTAVGGAPVTTAGGDAYGLVANLSYYDVRDLLYSRNGVAGGYTAEFGDDLYDSDYVYERHNLYYRKYTPVGGVAHRNINLNVELGIAAGRLFNRDAYSIGGSGSLRGFESGVAQGDAYFLTNIEYLSPLFDRAELRWVFFVDLGNAYREPVDLDPLDVRGASGVGLRWRIKSFVNTQLSIDVAHGWRDGAIKGYAYTSALF